MLKKLKRDNPYPVLAEKTAKLARDLEKAAAGGPVPVRFQHFASLFWGVMGDVSTLEGGVVRAPQDIPATQKAAFASGFHALLERGMYLAPSGYEVGFLATVHTDEMLGRVVRAFGEAVRSS